MQNTWKLIFNNHNIKLIVASDENKNQKFFLTLFSQPELAQCAHGFYSVFKLFYVLRVFEFMLRLCNARI